MVETFSRKSDINKNINMEMENLLEEFFLKE